jgi:hypothetical protein
VIGVAAVSFLGGGHLGGDIAVPDHDGPQLAVHDAHDGAHAALVGIGDGLQADQQLHPLLQLHPVFLTVAQPIEELIVAQLCCFTVLFAIFLELLGRSGERQPVQRRLPFAAGLGQYGFVLMREFLLRLADATALQRPGPQRFRPSAGRVAESAANSSAEIPAPTGASARSPTTLLDGVALINRPRLRSAAA